MFVFNENGCRSIIRIEQERLARVLHGIEFLERERDAATELMVRLAIEEALAEAQFERSKRELKIREMEHYLQGSAQGAPAQQP